MKKIIGKHKKHIKLLLKLGVSLSFLTWIVFRVDWNEVWSYARNMNPAALLIYAVLVLLGILVSAYKWQYLAAYKGMDFSLWDMFRFYFAGTFINNFMPSFIGGDTFRAYSVGKRRGNYFQATATVVVDRLTGLFGAMILSMAVALINYRAVIQDHLLLLIEIMVLLAFLAAQVFLKVRKVFYTEKFFRFIPVKFREFVRELDEYNNNATIYWTAIAYSLIFNLIGVAAANYVLFWGLGIQISPLNFLTVIFLTSIVSAIPVSINNIGIKEWAYITFFGLFGAAPAAVITAAITGRLLQMVLSFFALPIYLQDRRSFIKERSQEIAEGSSE